MKRLRLFSFLLAWLLLLPVSVWATPVTYSGAFTSDDQVELFAVQVATTETVTLRTVSYAQGGFDPVLTLYDGSGMFLETNDDGVCGVVGQDASTGNCFDSYMELSLLAGTYTLALTEADNLPVGDLLDGFSQAGNGDFSCPEFLGRPGAFCDASPSQRGANFEVDITVAGAGMTATPEPNSVLLVLTGCALLVCLRWPVRVLS